MSALANQSLLNCTQNNIALTHEQLSTWHIRIENKQMQVTKMFKFKNYAQAVAFTNRVAELAEQENHQCKLVDTHIGRIIY